MSLDNNQILHILCERGGAAQQPVISLPPRAAPLDGHIRLPHVQALAAIITSRQSPEEAEADDESEENDYSDEEEARGAAVDVDSNK